MEPRGTDDKPLDNVKGNSVVMNVNGTRFEVSQEVFKRMTDSARVNLSSTESVGMEYYFNRNLRAFLMILDYFQHGELHLPQDLCPRLFRRELDYWGLSDTRMEECCHRRMISHQEDDRMLKLFNTNVTESMGNQDHKNCFTWRLKSKMWCILDKPKSSRFARAYLFLSIIVVVISLFVMAAGTHPYFMRELDDEEFEDLYHHKFGKPPPSGMKPPTQRFRRNYPLEEDTSETDYLHRPKLSSGNVTEQHDTKHSGHDRPTHYKAEDEEETITYAYARLTVLDYLEYVAMTFFSLELILRLLVCPSICIYLKDAINICDIIALAAMYIKLIVDLALPTERYSLSMIDFIECLQTFRVFRFFRIVKDVTGFRVLIYTIKMSTKELCLLVMYLLLCVVMFSGIAYYCERSNMKSIPDAMWWVVVTMTTVGYGDMYPTSYPGKLVGCLAAICGVLLIAVTIPVFVNNFILLYTYSKTLEVRKTTAKTKGKTLKKIRVQPQKT